MHKKIFLMQPANHEIVRVIIRIKIFLQYTYYFTLKWQFIIFKAHSIYKVQNIHFSAYISLLDRFNTVRQGLNLLDRDLILLLV